MRLSRTLPLPLLVCAVIGTAAIAQTIDSDARVFPYAGYLEVDGAPANGAFDLNVGLFALPSGGVDCDTVSFTDVDVNAGQFQVLLDNVNNSCFGGGQLYLEIAVAAAGETLVVLNDGNRQIVGSVPHAASGSPLGEMFGEAVRTKRLTVQTDDTDNRSLANGMSLLVTGVMGSGLSDDGGVEFRHDNQTQGIGFGFNTIYASGSNDDQALNVVSRGVSPLTLNRAGGGDVNVSTSLNVTGDVTVGGTVTSALRACPSGMSPFDSGSGRSRLCVVRQTSPTNWFNAASSCWSTYGAELCTLSRMRIAASQGLTPVVQHFLADRPDDDVASTVNNTNATNFDGFSNVTAVLDGGYCCIMLSQ